MLSMKSGIQPLLQQVQPEDGAVSDRHKVIDGVRDADQPF